MWQPHGHVPVIRNPYYNIKRNDNGQLFVDSFYKNGKEVGVTTYWHDNGVKSQETHNQNNSTIEWNRDGSLKRKP